MDEPTWSSALTSMQRAEGSLHSSLRPLTAALVLADGTVIRGHGLGAEGMSVGEVCFNTGMTGYQESLSDPSYAGQILSFTFPHIGIVGANSEDMETAIPAVRGAVLRSTVASPSNFRAAIGLSAWLSR